MACDCVKNFNKLLKEKYNETATVNCEVLSGRVIVNGIYHKPKFKGKPGEYQQKWDEVMLWSKYCPFCGKPYDIKEIQDKETEIGAALIKEERCRQITQEGYDQAHDKLESVDALTMAGASYAIADMDRKESEAWWPWSFDMYKPKERLRNLVRAGALIAAAIDRLFPLIKKDE